MQIRYGGRSNSVKCDFHTAEREISTFVLSIGIASYTVKKKGLF